MPRIDELLEQMRKLEEEVQVEFDKKRDDLHFVVEERRVRFSEAVMELLRDLHRQGATICMVTHDPRYAEHADRTIHLFDGQVVEESVQAASSSDK